MKPEGEGSFERPESRWTLHCNVVGCWLDTFGSVEGPFAGCVYIKKGNLLSSWATASFSRGTNTWTQSSRSGNIAYWMAQSHCCEVNVSWEKFPAFYGAQSFSNVFTKPHHSILSWGELIHHTPMYEGWNFNSGNYLLTTDTK